MKLSVLGIAIFLLTGPVVVADELDDSYQGLQDAVTKKDAAQVKKLAVQVFDLTGKAIAAPEPTNPIEKEDWPNRIKYAKEAQGYAEYALFATGIQSESATMVDLLGLLEQKSPKSKYLDDGYESYLAALHQVGKDDAIPAIAEKAIANFPNNPDLLYVLANNALAKKQPDRATSYATRLVAAATQHPKPDQVQAADWERKKTLWLGRGYWIDGVVAGDKNLYAQANKSLRAALPLIRGDQYMMGTALFYLGIANYQLGAMTNNKAQVLEGAKFSEQAAAIEGPLKQRAWANAQSIKATADKMR